MPEARHVRVDDVARKEFASSFRGFDQNQVRAFLGRIASEIASLQARERFLEERLAAAEARAVPIEIGESELEQALGQETTRILHAAREAAQEIRTRAEEQVARLVREATAVADRAREEAGSIVADRTAEAERVAVAIREEAAAEAAARQAEAEAVATAAIESAKEQGRQMIGEAQAVRERILKDLARRRRLGQEHLEQLRAGRDRLLEGCGEVQTALDAAVAGLVVSEPYARAAAEAAGLRIASQAEPTLEELEAEVAAAVAAGLVVPAPSPDETPAEHGVETEAVAAGGDPATETEGNGSESAADVDAPAEPAGATPVPTGGQGSPDRGERSAPTPVAAGTGGATKPSALRRKKRREVPAAVGAADVGDAREHVRILAGAPAPAPGADPQSDGVAASAAVDPPPSAPAGAAVPEPVEARSTGGEPQVDDEPAGGATATEVAPTDESGAAGDEGRSVPVDDVFSRIRASRAASVAHATAVLAERAQPSNGETPADPGGPPVAEAATSASASASAEVPEGPRPVELVELVELVEPVEPADAAAGAVASAFEQRDAAVEAQERALTRALKRALADEQNELLDALRRAKGVPSLEALLPAVEEHEQRYRKAASGPLKATAAAAAAGVEGPVDISDVSASLGREVVVGLRPRLERALEHGAGDEAAANDAISATYREWKTSRAEPLARHHVLAAHAEGTFTAASDGALRWVVDPELGCSPDCSDNALAGATPKGEPFPTGQLHPPAHAGCRCLVLPADQ